jgi:hypothetical protein
MTQNGWTLPILKKQENGTPTNSAICSHSPPHLSLPPSRHDPNQLSTLHHSRRNAGGLAKRCPKSQCLVPSLILRSLRGEVSGRQSHCNHPHLSPSDPKRVARPVHHLACLYPPMSISLTLNSMLAMKRRSSRRRRRRKARVAFTRRTTTGDQ